MLIPWSRFNTLNFLPKSQLIPVDMGHVIQRQGAGTSNPSFTFGPKRYHWIEITLYRRRIPISYCFVTDTQFCHGVE